MAATNEKGKGKAIFIAILPFLALLIVMIFVIYLWRFYHPNGTIDLHQNHSMLLLHHITSRLMPARFS